MTLPSLFDTPRPEPWRLRGEPSSSLRKSRKRVLHAFAEQRQPFDRLVAEHEADVAICDLAAPASHRRCRDLLLQQHVGDVRAVEPELREVDEQRPCACGTYCRQALELAHRLVAPALPLFVRGLEAVVLELERNTRADLVEAARDEPVVDVA